MQWKYFGKDPVLKSPYIEYAINNLRVRRNTEPRMERAPQTGVNISGDRRDIAVSELIGVVGRRISPEEYFADFELRSILLQKSQNQADRPATEADPGSE